MIKELVMSREGLKKLEAELEELKTVRRKEVAEKIKTALGYGDLSENSEYDEAKNEQAIVEGRIAEIEAQLKHVRILDESQLSDETGHAAGDKVLVVMPSGAEVTFEILSISK